MQIVSLEDNLHEISKSIMSSMPSVEDFPSLLSVT